MDAGFGQYVCGAGGKTSSDHALENNSNRLNHAEEAKKSKRKENVFEESRNMRGPEKKENIQERGGWTETNKTKEGKERSPEKERPCC